MCDFSGGNTSFIFKFDFRVRALRYSTKSAEQNEVHIGLEGGGVIFLENVNVDIR